MTWIEGAIVGVVLLILGSIVGAHVVRYRYQRTCLEHGFPELRIMTYCVKRVNQTDSVVPLASFR